ncbi:50S ribosomal protein L25 [Candidatus Annandia pinicola]|uniref:50S ribosomal protein L25 n=1 Tax=Candidatus Annandia pinicola TaxID=1345117 RepID=UPI001D014E4D|nr:50S ribosomal protein L25 [Candidatus Annandia pinicola]UDG80315.1 50S ribosomal protein L25 [Candidatus Annandia pinicola]
MLIIEAKKRNKTGKNYNRILRNNNKIPAIIYGSFLPNNILIEIYHNKIINLHKKKIFYENIIILIKKKKYLVKLKEIQYHHFKNQIIHIDFLIIKN